MRINLKSADIRRIVFLVFAAYALLWLVNLPSIYVLNVQKENPYEWWLQMIRAAWNVFIWAVLTLVILRLGCRFPVTGKNRWRNICLHLVVGIASGTFRLVIFKFGLWTIGLSSFEGIQNDLSKSGIFIQSVTEAVVHYPTIIAVQQAYLYFQESRERAFRLQQAELEMLKMQLRPHFFFNTLNAISALTFRSPKEANEMIVRLGDLFRNILRKDKAQHVPLKEELEFLESFLLIHKTLMGKRLRIEWQIEPRTLDALVPNLILQPLAENAIQHGIAPRTTGGQITIFAERRNGDLLLEIRDDGKGLGSKTGGTEHGVGLSNTRARLASLYGEAHDLSIGETIGGGGVTVKIKIPFTEQITNEK